DPELVLVRVAAGGPDLLADRESGRLDPGELADDLVAGTDLDAEVAGGRRGTGRDRQVQRRPGRRELRVVGLLLHGRLPEEGPVEVAGGGEIGHVQVDVDVRKRHGFSFQQQAVSRRTRSDTVDGFTW